MSGNYEIYNPQNAYLTKDGQIYTEAMFMKDYPASVITTMVVYLYGRTIDHAETFDYLRGKHGIKVDIPDDVALNMIASEEEGIATESTPIERIAASLEFLVLQSMKGVEVSE